MSPIATAEQPAAPAFAPSQYQQALFDWIDRQVELMERGEITAEAICAVVEAVAGSGKTTTLKQALKRIPARFRCVFLAFNTSIKKELAKAIQELKLSHCRAMTLNGIGMNVWTRGIGIRGGDDLVDEDKSTRIIKWLLLPTIAEKEISESWSGTLRRIAERPRNPGMPAGAVKKLVGLMKHHLMVPAALHGKKVPGLGVPYGQAMATDEELRALATRFDITLAADRPDERVSEAEILDMARDVLIVSICKARKVMDFDDQVYLPVIFDVPTQAYDWIFVDEAQDVSHANRALLHKVRGQRGRLVAVGDSCQAIYGFRGACSDSMQLIRDEFNAIALPLSITYRCATSIVEEAQKIVPHIEARPGAPAGKVEHLGKYTVERFVPGKCLIMCRNMAPLVGFAYRLLADRLPVRVVGRDIGKNLISFIWSLRPSSLADLATRAQEWAEQQLEILQRVKKGSAKTDAAVQNVLDRLETINTLVRDSGCRTVEELEASISSMFGDEEEGRVLLSTIHRAKGLEAEEAYLLEPQLLPSPYATQAWQKEQERNLHYVAITRGKLFYGTITRDGLKRPTGRPQLKVVA